MYVFGLSSAPGIFQRTIENLLQNIDDILITGPGNTSTKTRISFA